MSKIDKLCCKFYKRPVPTDITFHEVVSVFTHYGCIIEYGGKHPKVVHKESGTVIPVPNHNDYVPEDYIRQLKVLLTKLRGDDLP